MQPNSHSCCQALPVPASAALPCRKLVAEAGISQSPELVPLLHWGCVCTGSFGDSCSTVSAPAAPGLLFFIAFCDLMLVPQWSALSRREEGSPAWASRLGLKGSDDKNARNESFGQGGSHLVSIRQRNRRSLVFLLPPCCRPSMTSIISLARCRDQSAGSVCIGTACTHTWPCTLA